MSDALQKADIGLIMIYINEAHSSAWPVALPNQPDPHESIQDRLMAAKRELETFNTPYPLFVDSWENDFETKFHAWPDVYFLIDTKSKRILTKSTYEHVRGEALVDEDCLVCIDNLLKDPSHYDPKTKQ